MTPGELLDIAASLLASPPSCMEGCWQRGCASVIRSALEQGLEEYWTRKEPSLVGRPLRHQLLALNALADQETAALAPAAWYGLSRAVHHHTYELAPTAAELQGWHHEVTTVLALLDAAKTTPTGTGIA